MWFLAMYNVTKIFNIRCLYVLYCKNIVESSAFCPLIPTKKKKKNKIEKIERKKKPLLLLWQTLCANSRYIKDVEKRERERKGELKLRSWDVKKKEKMDH